MSIHLVVAKGSGPTGTLLTGLLREQGLEVVNQGATAIVSYGVHIRENGVPVLNGMAGATDKLEQARQLYAKLGDKAVSVLTREEAKRHDGIVLARKAHHKGGKDIRIGDAAEGDWFTPYLASVGEVRTWIYRGRHMGTYAKVLRYPEKFRKIGRNYANGFAFELVRGDSVPREAVQLASEAVTILGLDFGAVDILQRTSGGLVVLEVNTAPGVEGPRDVIVRLAEHIAGWEKGGYKRRNGDPANQKA